MVPASILNRPGSSANAAPAPGVAPGVKPGGAAGAGSGVGAGVGAVEEKAGGESFEKTLKRAGDQRELKRSEEGKAAKADSPVETGMEKAEEVSGKEGEAEEVAGEQAKKAKEGKGKKPAARPDQMLDPMPAGMQQGLAQALVEPVVIEDTVELGQEEMGAMPEIPVGAIAEMGGEVEGAAAGVSGVGADVAEYTELAGEAGQWSVPGLQGVAKEDVNAGVEAIVAGADDGIVVQGFEADAQVGMIELDPAAMQPVEGVEMPEADLRAMASDVQKGESGSALEMAGEAGDGEGEGAEGESVDAFASWVEKTFGQGEEGAKSVAAAAPAPAPGEQGVMVKGAEVASQDGAAGGAEKPAMPVEARFAQENHPRIVTAVRSEIMASGGKMEIQLDPPELGALQVKIEMRDGVMTASFQTSSDEATRLLSHSLAHLKNTLEAAGINVEKLQVQQAPREEQSGRGEDGGRRQGEQGGQQEGDAKQEQQRREMLQRMWRRIAVGSDPVDLMA